MKLTIDLFNKAQRAIKENGRKVDIAFFEYKFKNGSREAVINELKKYQNEDGGFGNGIEPDFRLRASSPMATTVGLQYCLKIDLPPDDEIYSSSINYLLNHFNEKEIFWPYVYENVQDEPHAPWWNVKKVTTPTNEQWPNPSAEIAGYLFKFQNLVSKTILDKLAIKITSVLKSSAIIPGFLYNIMCYERVLEFFPLNIQSILKDKIKRTYESLNPLTQEKLGEIRVFFLTKSPTDPIYQVLKDDVNRLLDTEIYLLTVNEACIPTWKWGMFEEAWENAKKEWIGKLTIDLLITLKNYNRYDFKKRMNNGVNF